MSKLDIFDTIARLRDAGEPFCVATVVRTADVTSAKAGAKAAVTASGEIMGHLGGGCVTSAVRKAAAQANQSGETALIRVKPSERVVALTDDDGAQVFKSGCPSGGTVDVLIEPYALPPVLAIFGATPIARAIAEHARLAGLRVATSQALGFDGWRSFEGADISPLALSAADFVVVASQGAQDAACLRAALESPAERVSMVASRRKADALCARLANDLPAEQIARLKSPAGLDLGGIDPHDIALSVMAEIVQWRNARRNQQEKGQANEQLA